MQSPLRGAVVLVLAATLMGKYPREEGVGRSFWEEGGSVLVKTKGMKIVMWLKISRVRIIIRHEIQMSGRMYLVKCSV